MERTEKKKVLKHGRFHGMFPMKFKCEACDCEFECVDLYYAAIHIGDGHAFACSECPECGEWADKDLGRVKEADNERP